MAKRQEGKFVLVSDMKALIERIEKLERGESVTKIKPGKEQDANLK